MIQPLLSKRKSEAIANGAFLVGLGILFYTNAWWPGILLVVWVPLALRQYISGRIYDFFVSSAILIGLFLIAIFNWDWSVLMPLLLIIGGIYIIFREYFCAEDTNGKEKSQEIRDDTDDS